MFFCFQLSLSFDKIGCGSAEIIENYIFICFCAHLCVSLPEKAKVMTIKEFFSFRKNRLFWWNIIAMVVVAAGIIFGVLKALDVYTRHGEAVVVPDVKGLSLSEAQKMFADRGLACVVADSNYVKTLPAGCILDYTPGVGQRVKEGRLIYLTINTLNVPLQEVPDVADNSSVRQAEARLLAVGFRLTSNDSIPGEKDWVYAVKYRGDSLGVGAKVPVGAVLTLVIGNGKEVPLPTDSLGIEATEGLSTGSQPEAGQTLDEEDWF